MERLFSAFPSRWPGVGLVILRVTLIFALSSHVRVAPMTLTIPSASAAILVALGLGTPVLSALVVVMYGISAALGALEIPAAILVSGIAASLGFLGPGAYSVDARLFGWRHVSIGSAWGRTDHE
jgi:putative oxidoreductase